MLGQVNVAKVLYWTNERKIQIHNNIIQEEERKKMIKEIIVALVNFSIYAESVTEGCECLNGGSCVSTLWGAECMCPLEYIGRYCQTKTNLISNSSLLANLNDNYTYFTTLISQANRYRFNFDVCMAQNPEDLENLIYFELQNENGIIKGDPSYLKTSKIYIKEGKCLSISTQFLQISSSDKQKPTKIVFGIKALSKSFKNFFFRSISGNNHREFTNQLQSEKADRIQSAQEYNQKVFIKSNIELYEQPLSEKVLRKIIKIMLIVLVVLFVLFVGMITIYSYDIEVKDILAKIQLIARAVCKTLLFFKKRTSYKQYRHLKAQDNIESQTRIHSVDDCAICLQAFNENEIIKVTNCNHLYHQDCLEGWSIKNDTCPLCRKLLHPKEAHWLSKLLDN